jgi:hypothetical protein
MGTEFYAFINFSQYFIKWLIAPAGSLAFASFTLQAFSEFQNQGGIFSKTKIINSVSNSMFA